MSDGTAIEWADASWNPIRSTTGRHYCEKISPGCDHCYASTMTKRLARHEYPKVSDAGEPGQKVNGVTPILDDRALGEPVNWREPRKVFVCSMTDLFGEWVPDEWIDRVFFVMAMTPQHTYQVLTKRPARMRAAIERLGIGHGLAPLFADSWPLPNVWLGVSVESDAYAWRARTLAEIPATVRFISAEPLIEPIPAVVRELGRRNDDGSQVHHWIITGGESGPGARPAHPDWFRQVRDRCVDVGVAFFHKQNGEWLGSDQVTETGGPVQFARDFMKAKSHTWPYRKPPGAPHYGMDYSVRVGKKAAGRMLDGRTWDEFPGGQS